MYTRRTAHSLAVTRPTQLPRFQYLNTYPARQRARRVTWQAGVAALGGGLGGGAELGGKYVRALENAVADRFGSNLIHCMCHSTGQCVRHSLWSAHANPQEVSPCATPQASKCAYHPVHIAYCSTLS